LLDDLYGPGRPNDQNGLGGPKDMNGLGEPNKPDESISPNDPRKSDELDDPNVLGEPADSDGLGWVGLTTQTSHARQPVRTGLVVPNDLSRPKTLMGRTSSTTQTR